VECEKNPNLIKKSGFVRRDEPADTKPGKAVKVMHEKGACVHLIPERNKISSEALSRREEE
jgi:hypothetical protein